MAPKKPFAVQGDAAKAEAALKKANPVVGDAVKKARVLDSRSLSHRTGFLYAAMAAPPAADDIDFHFPVFLSPEGLSPQIIVV